MNRLRFLTLAGSLTLRQDRANVRREDLPNSSVSLELLLPAANARPAASRQISATPAMFQRLENVAMAVPHRAVSVKSALSPREANANPAVSPEATAWTAALRRDNARQEALALKTRRIYSAAQFRTSRNSSFA
jgi:hypothetical protein